MPRRKRQSLTEGMGVVAKVKPGTLIDSRTHTHGLSEAQWLLALDLLKTPITVMELLKSVGCDWTALDKAAASRCPREWTDIKRRHKEIQAEAMISRLVGRATQAEPSFKRQVIDPAGGVTETIEHQTDAQTVNAALAKLLPDVYGDKSDAPAVGQAIQVNITIDGKSPDLSVLGNFSDLGRKTMGEDAP